MFDVGFWELVVIGVVALLVFGPEKLPGLARKAGYWLGRARRQLHEVRAEIEREMAVDEMRRLQNKIEMPELKDLAKDIRNASPLTTPKAGGDAAKPGGNTGSS